MFGKKKTIEVEAPKKEAAGEVLRAPKGAADAIVAPRITEKAALLGDRNVYTFEVRKGATKFEVRDAVKALYNVVPQKIRMVNKVPRHYMSRSRGTDRMEHGLRKAYVYLKKGDRIELV